MDSEKYVSTVRCDANKIPSRVFDKQKISL